MARDRIVFIIPARLASTRLPRKLMLTLVSEPEPKTVLQMTYEGTLRSRFANRENVWLATGDEEIEQSARGFGAKVIRTRVDCNTGTDRIVEAWRSNFHNEVDAIVNVQGDEPFVSADHIDAAINGLLNNEWADVATCAVASAGTPSSDPSKVKAVVDKQNRALYFSRSPIPYGANRWLRHLGIYVYRPIMLQKLSSMRPSELELSENLEQLRWIDNGTQIFVATVEGNILCGIDTPDDFERAKAYLSNIKT